MESHVRNIETDTLTRLFGGEISHCSFGTFPILAWGGALGVCFNIATLLLLLPSRGKVVYILLWI